MPATCAICNQHRYNVTDNTDKNGGVELVAQHKPVAAILKYLCYCAFGKKSQFLFACYFFVWTGNWRLLSQ
jgi:hypothetical protein